MVAPDWEISNACGCPLSSSCQLCFFRVTFITTYTFWKVKKGKEVEVHLSQLILLLITLSFLGQELML